jgi:hypothetical protein
MRLKRFRDALLQSASESVGLPKDQPHNDLPRRENSKGLRGFFIPDPLNSPQWS